MSLMFTGYRSMVAMNPGEAVIQWIRGSLKPVTIKNGIYARVVNCSKVRNGPI